MSFDTFLELSPFQDYKDLTNNIKKEMVIHVM